MWEEHPVIDEIAKDGKKHLGGKEDSALYVDETGILKKGNQSGGVQCRWFGRLASPYDDGHVSHALHT